MSKDLQADWIRRRAWVGGHGAPRHTVRGALLPRDSVTSLDHGSRAASFNIPIVGSANFSARGFPETFRPRGTFREFVQDVGGARRREGSGCSAGVRSRVGDGGTPEGGAPLSVWCGASRRKHDVGGRVTPTAIRTPKPSKAHAIAEQVGEPGGGPAVASAVMTADQAAGRLCAAKVVS